MSFFLYDRAVQDSRRKDNISINYHKHDIFLRFQPLFINLYNTCQMISQYEHTFRQQKLIHKELYHKILAQFGNYNPHKYYNYDELISILDQSIHNKCNRDVFSQLFNQSSNRSKQANISESVQKYIQNIQTSRLCIMRDQFKRDQLERERKGQRTRDKTFIFLKLMQASIYTRFTKSPLFQYKIEPTELPAVTLANALNPLMDHEYTLQMQQQQFYIIFYESGIQILRWFFPDQHDLKQGQYIRFIKSQNVSFEMKIKYMPKHQSKTKDSLNIQINSLNTKIQRQKNAFIGLCKFQPFLQKKSQIQADPNTQHHGLMLFTDNIFSFLPCLRNHVKILHTFLILALMIQCMASSFWPIQFIDICFCFYGLGFIYDRKIQDDPLRIIVMQIILLLLILKSIWAGVYQPYTQKTNINKWILILSSIVKGIIIVILFVMLIRRQEIHELRQQFLSRQQSKQRSNKENLKDKREYNILE